MGQPQEIADAIVFLAGGRSSFVCGTGELFSPPYGPLVDSGAVLPGITPWPHLPRSYVMDTPTD